MGERNNMWKNYVVHLPITLLHYGDLFNNLLQIRLNRNLLNCNDLTSLFVDSFEHTAIGSVARKIDTGLEYHKRHHNTSRNLAYVLE